MNTISFTGAGARDFFQMSCVPLLRNETFVEVRHFFACKRPLAIFKMWYCLIILETIFLSLLFCAEPWNGSFIAFFLGYHYRSVRFREVVLSITVPYS